jgi:aspartyl/asparaginyl-tRNA synthetase
LGIERLLLWVTQSHDIRDMTLLLRDHRYILAP